MFENFTIAFFARIVAIPHNGVIGQHSLTTLNKIRGAEPIPTISCTKEFQPAGIIDLFN